ncbi:MAG: hypothetical protein HYV09_22470 [Deltaproteobacteria bacterium]|nr:hypothetical protein [Deltaproteobacteria bacterium]
MRALPILALLLSACGSAPPPHVAPPVAKPARVARSGALFVVDFEALLPVGCYDAVRKAWSSGEACLDLVPEESTVQLESGRLARTSGHRVPTVTQCTLSTKLLNFEDGRAEKAASFALWPATSEGRMKRVDWSASKGGSGELPEKDRARVVAAMEKLGGASDLKVVQITSSDLDGDGTSELLYSVTGNGFDPTTRKGTSALLLSDHRLPDLTAVRTSDHAVFRVEGVVDVDDDGLKEVWLSERTFHPNGMRSDSMTLAWPAPGGLTPLPPVESCWPPGKG